MRAPARNVFVYGTLRDRALLGIVLGRALDGIDIVAADLPGFAVLRALDQAFPTLRPAPGKLGSGLLLRALTPDDIARLDHYEGGFGYALGAITVQVDGQPEPAEVYQPPADQPPPASDEAWSLLEWAARWGAVTREAAHEVMGWQGRMAPADVGARHMPIRIRAAARLAARARPPDPTRDLARDVIEHARHRPYMNFFAIEEIDLRFRRHDGTLGPVLNRGALMVGQAAVVLPYDPVRDCVLLVEQFRAALYLLGDPAPWVWEPVAGLVDPGETPEQAARREAMEEAGLILTGLERAGGCYSSTGASAEYLHLFVGLADLDGSARGSGLASEGEDIRSRILSFDALLAGVDAHGYCDMPLVTTALWLARHRDRLRA